MVLAGYRFNEKIEEMLQCGCRGYIQKPFSLNDLSIKVKQMMDTEI
jgi:two-component system, cell cycle sensor histidine kinase and response regulator CckA